MVVLDSVSLAAMVFLMLLIGNYLNGFSGNDVFDGATTFCGASTFVYTVFLTSAGFS